MAASNAAAVEYRIARHAAKLGTYRHRSSVEELSIRKQTRPASVSAGRCVFNELGEANDDQRRRETMVLAPRLAPRLPIAGCPFDGQRRIVNRRLLTQVHACTPHENGAAHPAWALMRGPATP